VACTKAAEFAIHDNPKLMLKTEFEGSTITLTATLSATGRWFAVGFNDGDTPMVGGKIVMGIPAGGATQRSIIGQGGPADIPVDTDTVIREASLVEDNGKTILKWTRDLDAGPTRVTLSDDPTAEVRLMYAIGGDGTLAYHGSDRANQLANLFTGETTVIVNPTKRLHGILMFVAWGVLAPVAMMIARFAKQWPWFGDNGRWFKHFHRPMMILAVLITWASFIIALIMVEGNHFMVTHTYFGLVVVICATYQPINAAMRGTHEDHAQMTRKRVIFETVHKATGRTAILIGLVAIPTGIKALGGSDAFFTFYIVWASLLAVVFIALSIKMQLNKSNGK
jgi:uncharacterized Zn-binding protein involved in type VI secretion